MSSSSASLPFRAFKEISSESRSVTALAFSPSGEYIAYGSEEGIVAIHELQTSKSYDGKVCSRVTGLKWVPNRQEPALIISERNGHLHVLARVAGQFKETVNVMGFIAPVTALDIYTNPPYICLAVGNGDVVDLVTLNIHTLKEGLYQFF
ncbi:hypothetical protein VKT23_019198 [Stygiomarasmius scandens]|uniref:Anaphase-promoting complex subunit 4 WD40 domain-containing protein n=1 Tax=Marasmiellus scandens TaxID=2682957 RepID=A0ABR1IPG6_9AGAR